MRIALKCKDGERMTFTGVVGRYGGKGGSRYTVLITDVCFLDGGVATDHVWFNLTLGFKKARLSPGELIFFDARVKPYVKGYQGKKKGIDRPVQVDYKLSHPTKIKRRFHK